MLKFQKKIVSLKRDKFEEYEIADKEMFGIDEYQSVRIRPSVRREPLYFNSPATQRTPRDRTAMQTK